MLKITDNTTGKVRYYAERNPELINSLFKDSPLGTVGKFYKITRENNAILYWIDDSRGVYEWTPSKIWGKFTKLSNGKIYAQYTLDKIERIAEHVPTDKTEKNAVKRAQAFFNSCGFMDITRFAGYFPKGYNRARIIELYNGTRFAD